jgi:hypothetical protein
VRALARESARCGAALRRIDAALEPARRLAAIDPEWLLLRTDAIVADLTASTTWPVALEAVLARLERPSVAVGTGSASRSPILPKGGQLAARRAADQVRRVSDEANRLTPRDTVDTSRTADETETDLTSGETRRLAGLRVAEPPFAARRGVDSSAGVEARAASTRTLDDTHRAPSVGREPPSVTSPDAPGVRVATTPSVVKREVQTAAGSAPGGEIVGADLSTSRPTLDTDSLQVTIHNAVEAPQAYVEPRVWPTRTTDAARRSPFGPAAPGVSGLRRLAALATERLEEPSTSVEPVQNAFAALRVEEELERLLRLEAQANGIDIQGDVR